MKKTYKKMNPKAKKMWLKALRTPKTEDGHYLQTRGQLIDHDAATGDDSFCCLGVLANEINKTGVLDGQETLVGSYGSLAGRAWAKLDPGVVYMLANMNDERRFSFNSIANWIEKNL